MTDEVNANDSDNNSVTTLPTELHMLTTTDNPYNPFTHYDEWLGFDTDAGYFSNNLLARITVSSDELSDYDQDLALEQAIDEIVKENALGIHRKISQSDSPITVLSKTETN